MGCISLSHNSRQPELKVVHSQKNTTENLHRAYQYRIHDARLGRFLSRDPLAKEFAWNSPYAFSENRVIDGIDLEGLEWEPLITKATVYYSVLKVVVNDYIEGNIQKQTDVINYQLKTGKPMTATEAAARGSLSNKAMNDASQLFKPVTDNSSVSTYVGVGLKANDVDVGHVDIETGGDGTAITFGVANTLDGAFGIDRNNDFKGKLEIFNLDVLSTDNMEDYQGSKDIGVDKGVSGGIRIKGNPKEIQTEFQSNDFRDHLESIKNSYISSPTTPMEFNQDLENGNQ